MKNLENCGKIKLSLISVAANLDIDKSTLIEIEKGQRKPNREQVIKLPEIYLEDEKTCW